MLFYWYEIIDILGEKICGLFIELELSDLINTPFIAYYLGNTNRQTSALHRDKPSAGPDRSFRDKPSLDNRPSRRDLPPANRKKKGRRSSSIR